MAGVLGIATVMLSCAHSDEEPFQPGRGVIGSLALVPVRQQQHQAGALAPLLLAGADEFVHDRLRAVDEVAELGLPADQGVGPGDRVAVLEADRRELRQQRVVGVEPGARRVLNARSGVYSSPVCRSTSTACRWPNVPRRVSWPTSRTVWPSISSAPNASSSPVAQSISSRSTMAARRCSCGSSLGCGVKPSGRFSWVSMMCLMVSSVIAVGVPPWSAGSWLRGLRPDHRAGLRRPADASRVSVKARSSSCW